MEIAQGMASGDIHPETRVPIVDEWPDFQPASRSSATTAAPGVLAESSKVNAGASAKKGPMDAFVSRELLPARGRKRTSTELTAQAKRSSYPNQSAQPHPAHPAYPT